jgi:hypothetical protein
MPLYNTATVATAIGATDKWLDNLLSHTRVTGVQSESQGVSRRLSLAAVTQIALTKDLVDLLNVPVSTALRIAAALLEDPDGKALGNSPLHITLDLDEFRAGVLESLARAVELAPTRLRGRPRGRPPKR